MSHNGHFIPVRYPSDKLVKLEEINVESIPYETVRQVLKKRPETVEFEPMGDSTREQR
ncbi:hypothetical protein JCM18750_35200 [Halostagnicola bangensis]